MAAAQPTPASSAAAALSRDVLSEALPFIKRFRGKTVVVKYDGGVAMKSPEL